MSRPAPPAFTIDRPTAAVRRLMRKVLDPADETPVRRLVTADVVANWEAALEQRDYREVLADWISQLVISADPFPQPDGGVGILALSVELGEMALSQLPDFETFESAHPWAFFLVRQVGDRDWRVQSVSGRPPEPVLVPA